eukprot:jgi/Ulvmu1/8258/UM041_0069.1
MRTCVQSQKTNGSRVHTRTHTNAGELAQPRHASMQARTRQDRSTRVEPKRPRVCVTRRPHEGLHSCDHAAHLHTSQTLHTFIVTRCFSRTCNSVSRWRCDLKSCDDANVTYIHPGVREHYGGLVSNVALCKVVFSLITHSIVCNTIML